MVIGTIIVAGLLALVVDMNNSNLQDTSRSETQREMQLAMNYMVQDLREAVYVYDGTCLTGNGTPNSSNFATICPGIVNAIPSAMKNDTNFIPALAFWRADPLPDVLVKKCQTDANSSNPNDSNSALQTNNIPCVSGRSYTLVLYGIEDDTDPTDIWQGRARLIRYQLAQYNSSGNQTVGWSNPLPNSNSSFLQWPYAIDPTTGAVTNQQTQLPTNQADVLVDFLDDTNAATLFPNYQASNPNAICYDPTDPNPSTASNVRYVTSPQNPTNNIRSFYACVRGQTLNATSQETGVNQEVRLFLTGNVSGRAGFPLNTGSAATRLSPLQTQVFVRGIINKSPQG